MELTTDQITHAYHKVRQAVSEARGTRNEHLQWDSSLNLLGVVINDCLKKVLEKKIADEAKAKEEAQSQTGS